MSRFLSEDGCPSFHAVVDLPGSRSGEAFRWGVIVDGPAGNDQWGITTEVHDLVSTDRTLSFVLGEPSADGLPQRCDTT